VKCLFCAKRLSAAQIIIARSRGKTPSYCSLRCRQAAAKRRQRARAEQSQEATK
jgi:hypothetical protein